MNEIVLQKQWYINAPIIDVFNLITDFEKWPVNFPKVAESIQIKKRKGDHLELEATVKSFGQKFPVFMKTKIIPGKGFISDNESPKFGTSGHEELLLSESSDGTVIEYKYQVKIHKPWLRLVAKPLIGWFAMKFWEKAVINKIRNSLEK